MDSNESFPRSSVASGEAIPERVRPASYYLERNGPKISSYSLKRKLLAEKIFGPEGATCGSASWQAARFRSNSSTRGGRNVGCYGKDTA